MNLHSDGFCQTDEHDNDCEWFDHCIASSSASGDGVCEITGHKPVDCKASAVVGPIAATYRYALEKDQH